MSRRDLPQIHHSVPNLAPMVDVVMVILIFFMLGTTFAFSEGVLPTQLPSQVGPGGGASVTIVPAVRIALVDDAADPLGCRILVMEQALPNNSFDALKDYMSSKREAGADPSGRVLIAPMPDVEYQRVISAMDACVRAGFTNIMFGFGAEPSAGPS